MDFPNCSMCGKKHTQEGYNYWSIISFKKPELKMTHANPTYYVLCPDCQKELENNMTGYKRQKKIIWEEV